VPLFGFEPDETWTLGGDSGRAEIDTTIFYKGLQSLRLGLSGAPGQNGNAYSPDITPVNLGEEHVVSLWVYCDDNTDIAGHTLSIQHYNSIAFDVRETIGTIRAIDCNEDAWRHFEFTFTPSFEDPDRLYFATSHSGGAPWPIESTNFYIDRAFFVESTLAVRLAERAIDSVSTMLKNNLGTELGDIDTDRADGVTMAVPAATEYYNREKPEIAGPQAHVEVFEGTTINFLEPDSSDDVRTKSAIPLTVRVTWFNRDGDTIETMHDRKRRYACGVSNVINQDRGYAADANVKFIQPEQIEATVSTLDVNKFKGQVTMAVSVALEEII
jgi:hypothetical protein